MYSSENDHPDLPCGLLARMGQDPDAMETFFRFSEAERQAILDRLKSASTGEEAKSRMEHTLAALHEGRSGLGEWD